MFNHIKRQKANYIGVAVLLLISLGIAWGMHVNAMKYFYFEHVTIQEEQCESITYIEYKNNREIKYIEKDPVKVKAFIWKMNAARMKEISLGEYDVDPIMAGIVFAYKNSKKEVFLGFNEPGFFNGGVGCGYDTYAMDKEEMKQLLAEGRKICVNKVDAK